MQEQRFVYYRLEVYVYLFSYSETQPTSRYRMISSGWCHICPVAWLRMRTSCPFLSYLQASSGIFGHFENYGKLKSMPNPANILQLKA